MGGSIRSVRVTLTFVLAVAVFGLVRPPDGSAQDKPSEPAKAAEPAKSPEPGKTAKAAPTPAGCGLRIGVRWSPHSSVSRATILRGHSSHSVR